MENEGDFYEGHQDESVQENESLEQQEEDVGLYEGMDDFESEDEGEGEESPSRESESNPIESDKKIIAKNLGLHEDDVVIGKDGKINLVMKVNGKNRYFTPDQIVKGFNINQAGYEKLNQSKQLENKIKNYFESFKEDKTKIWDLADRLGYDKYELAQQLLEGKVEEMNMTDEQRAIHEKEKQYKKREEDLAKREEDIKKQQNEREVAEHKKRYDAELPAALNKHGFKTADNQTKRHILAGAVSKLMIANQLGRELTCDDAVALAKEEWQDYVHNVFDDIDDDHIVKVIPQRIIDAIRKADLNRLKVKPASSIDEQIELPEYEDDEQQVETPRRRRKQQTVTSYFENLGF